MKLPPPLCGVRSTLGNSVLMVPQDKENVFKFVGNYGFALNSRKISSVAEKLAAIL